MDCPCGSDQTYAQCCEPVIRAERLAATAEELMRARYTAYTQVEMDFLQTSLHPEVREEVDESSRDWAENSQWHGLEIINTSDGASDDDQGTVEFVARFTHEEKEQAYHEIASFEKVDGQWYFREGQPGARQPIVRDEPKIGRNDPCSCGSGRKYKKCCGV